MDDPIVVLCACDANYAQHLGVTLCSLMKNYHHANPLEIFIVDHGIGVVDLQRLVRLVGQHNATCHLVQVEASQLVGLRVTDHYTPANYLRIFAPQLLPEDIHQVLYLDSDLVVRDDVGTLWETDVSHYALAAVGGQGNPDLTQSSPLHLGQRFNSGVMLLNLYEWRVQNYSSRLLDFARTHPENMIFAEQSALNTILHDHWMALPLRWNAQSVLWSRDVQRLNPALDAQEVSEAKANPAIVHFTTSSKPWHYKNIHPWRQLYYEYLNQTEWRNYRPPDRTPGNVMRRVVRRSRRAVIRRAGFMARKLGYHRH